MPTTRCSLLTPTTRTRAACRASRGSGACRAGLRHEPSDGVWLQQWHGAGRLGGTCGLLPRHASLLTVHEGLRPGFTGLHTPPAAASNIPHRHHPRHLARCPRAFAGSQGRRRLPLPRRRRRRRRPLHRPCIPHRNRDVTLCAWS